MGAIFAHRGGFILNELFEQITDWLKEMLVSAIMNNLSGLFDTVNEQVGSIATEVGTTRRISRRGFLQ